jgi:COP9 signalosome complex subunit 3
MPVLQSALQTGFYKAVEGLLAQDILHFPGAGVMLPPSQYICTSTTPAYSYITIESGLTGKVSATDLLKYLVYSATINIGLGRWKRAVDILEVAVEYPTKENGLSRIMVEAYKKWFLLRAVIEGKVPNIPTTVGAQQQKVFRHLALPYEVLATLFCSGSLARLRSEVNVGRELWHADGNSGLVQMLVAKYSQQHVKRLSTVYKTISVHNIGSQNHTGDAARQEEQDEEATSLVRSLIACDEVRACIKEDDAGIQYVVLGEEDVLLKEELVQERLSDATSRLEMLVRDVKEINREFQLDKEYLKWMLKQKAAGDFIDLESAGQELKWGAGPDDEDLMAQ